MLHGLPAIFSTRSGEQLGRKTVKELTDIMFTRQNQCVRELGNAKRKEEFDDIERIKDHNRELFGYGDGRFKIRHASIQEFAVGELHVDIPPYKVKDESGTERNVQNSVRDEDAYIIHTAIQPQLTVDDLLAKYKDNVPVDEVRKLLKDDRDHNCIHTNLVESLLLAYTVGRWAARVTLVCPDQIYTRQDHARGREEITAKLIARLAEASRINSCIYLDLHAKQIPGFYENSPENLQPNAILIKQIMETMQMGEEDNSSVVMVTPDAGGAARARVYAEAMRAGLAIAIKFRDYSKHSVVEESQLIGDVREKDVAIVDDMIDTAGSIEKTVIVCKQAGARRVIAVTSHSIYSPPALDRLSKLVDKGMLEMVIDIGSIWKPQEILQRHPWIKQLSAARLSAETIYHMNMGLSVGNVYMGNAEPKLVKFD